MSKSATHRASYRSWTWGLALGALIYASAGWTAIGRTPGSFSVSQSGEANYTVPLFAPPGTAKMSPKLSLSYGHRAGGSWLGEGWGVSGLSAITRCPKTWAQDGLSREVKLDLTDRYHQSINCGLAGLLPLALSPPLDKPGIVDSIAFQYGRERYRYPSNLPKVAATGGPHCLSLPTVPYNSRPPFVVADVGSDPSQYGNQGLLLNSDGLKQLLFGPLDGPPRNTAQIGQPG